MIDGSSFVSEVYALQSYLIVVSASGCSEVEGPRTRAQVLPSLGLSLQDFLPGSLGSLLSFGLKGSLFVSRLLGSCLLGSLFTSSLFTSSLFTSSRFTSSRFTSSLVLRSLSCLASDRIIRSVEEIMGLVAVGCVVFLKRGLKLLYYECHSRVGDI